MAPRRSKIGVLNRYVFGVPNAILRRTLKKLCNPESPPRPVRDGEAFFSDPIAVRLTVR